MIFNQAEFDIRCEWGIQGLAQLAPASRVIVIVDILSFSTCIEVATQQKAIVYPYRWKDESATDYAQSVGAVLANFKRSYQQLSLSPVSLTSISEGTRLVLPSQNGATLSLQTGKIPTIAGCFRNCEAVARQLQRYETGISVIPAGERWPDGSLRPAIEDWLGAGAIMQYLTGSRSPEADMAIAAFERQANLSQLLRQCSSGKELIARGFERDVAIAAALNVSDGVPVLIDNAYVRQAGLSL
ncbi:MAG: hypothetical protein Kow00121_32240 [Elainellaceae cyanobacterium]